MVMVWLLGGSTNAVLHLIAMARAGCAADHRRLPGGQRSRAVLADLKPSGKYVQEDLHRVGGTPAVMKTCWRKAI